MGRGIAGNLIKAGHAVHVWDTAESARKPFARRAIVSEPADMAARCSLIFFVVPGSAEIDAMTKGRGGAYGDLAPSSTIAGPANYQVAISVRHPCDSTVPLVAAVSADDGCVLAAQSLAVPASCTPFPRPEANRSGCLSLKPSLRVCRSCNLASLRSPKYSKRPAVAYYMNLIKATVWSGPSNRSSSIRKVQRLARSPVRQRGCG